MRSYSLLAILLVVQVCTAQFAGSEETEVYDISELPMDDLPSINEAPVIDRSDFTRGTLLDVDTSYKSNYNGPEYNYKEPKEPEPIKERKPKENLNIGPVIGFIFKALLVIVGLAGLYFLYLSLSNLRLQRNSQKNRVISTAEQENDLADPEELNDGSLESLLRNAKANEDYILATRYYFLMYLKKLQDVEVIKYHREKTNADYLGEIQNPQLSEQFVKLSYMYEYAWYGKKEISSEVFNTVEKTFVHQIGTVK